MDTRRPVSVLLIGLMIWLPACAHEPRMYRAKPPKSLARSETAEPQIVRGRPNIIIDSLGHYVLSLPSKLILWNWQVDRHKVSEENELLIKQYLEVNDLDTVQIRLNTYAPHKEFGRLKRNKDVHGGYKYTIGILTWLFSTLLPGRLIGGDHYNPYTNTVHIFSNHPAILAHEAGHVRDFQSRKRRGTYAFMRIVPFVAPYQEWLASQDAVRYFHCRREDMHELNSYPILFPAWGTYAGGYGGIIGLAGAVIIGHTYGRYYRSTRRGQLRSEPPDTWLGECWTAQEALIHPAP